MPRPPEGETFAESINATFYETSALNSDNVEHALNDLIERIYHANNMGTKCSDS